MSLAARALRRRQDALVFLVSDFHWPAPDLDGLCGVVSRDVVPIVLWAQHEFDGWPRRDWLNCRIWKAVQRRTCGFGQSSQCNADSAGRNGAASCRTRLPHTAATVFFPGRVRGRDPECLLPWEDRH